MNIMPDIADRLNGNVRLAEIAIECLSPMQIFLITHARKRREVEVIWLPVLMPEKITAKIYFQLIFRKFSTMIKSSQKSCDFQLVHIRHIFNYRSYNFQLNVEGRIIHTRKAPPLS